MWTDLPTHFDRYFGCVVGRATDEAAWYELWHDEALGALEPAYMALKAGLLADRLPWVYLAGALVALGLVRASRGAGSGSHANRLIVLQILAAGSALGFWWGAGSLGPWPAVSSWSTTAMR